MTHHHDLIRRMAAELDHYRQLLTDDRREVHPLAVESRAVLVATDPIRATLERMTTMASDELDTTQAWAHSRPTWENVIAAARAALAAASSDGPAVPNGREPASVADQPSDEELLEINDGAYCPGTDEVNDEDDSSWQYTSDYIRWLDENGTPQEQGAYAAKGLRAVFEAGRRWGRPAPAPAGEVGELVAWLRETGQLLSRRPDIQCRVELRLFDRAADLLERQSVAEESSVTVPEPVPVSERLPGVGIKVLAHYLNDLGKGRTICAIWVPAKTRSDSYGDDDFTEYDEESDTFYWPEGWYEAIENWDDLGYVKVDEGEVIYWQPLPKWPANALPLPSGEVEA